MSEPQKPLSDMQITELRVRCRDDYFPKGGEMEAMFSMFQELVPSLIDENSMLKERVAELEKQVKADAGPRALWATHFGRITPIKDPKITVRLIEDDEE